MSEYITGDVNTEDLITLDVSGRDGLVLENKLVNK